MPGRPDWRDSRRPSTVAAFPGPPLCSAAGEALLASSTTDLETGAAGLFRLHYLLLPCTDGESSSDGGAAPALCAKRVASADELVPPLLAAEAAAPAALLPPALAEAVAGQLGAVPLEARLDPLALSSRCRDTIEVGAASVLPLKYLRTCMSGTARLGTAHINSTPVPCAPLQMLVRESQPLPKPQMPPPPAPEAAAPAPAAAPTPAPARTPAAPPAAAAQAKGRRAAAPAPVPAAAAAPRESGGRGAGGGKAGKGALEFRRSARR